MAKVGRPRALDEVKRKRFCALIALGFGFEEAAGTIGCRPLTVRREANRDPEFEKSWVDAQLTALANPLDTLRKAAGENWRAASWYVERVYSRQFAKQSPHYLTMESFEQMGEEMVAEICAVLPKDENTRRLVRRRFDRLTKHWMRDWRPGYTLAKKDRLTPEPPPPWPPEDSFDPSVLSRSRSSETPSSATASVGDPLSPSQPAQKEPPLLEEE